MVDILTSNAKESAPRLGDPAPTDTPNAMSEQQRQAFQRLVSEQVEIELNARLVAVEDEDAKKAREAQEDQQFNNFDKKLEVYGADLSEIRAKFRLRFINDTGDRLMRSQAMGWDFVSRKELALNDAPVVPLNQDMGDRIAVYVGTSEVNTPMRAFLMKMPHALWDKFNAVKERRDDLIEQSIKRGAIGTALQQGGYAGTDQGQVKINYASLRNARIS